MGWAAGRKLRKAIDGLTRVLAIEILTASRAVAIRSEAASPALQPIVDLVNSVTGGPGPDRFMSPEIDAVVDLVATRTITQSLESRSVTLT